MDNFNDTIEHIKEKIGEESSALISDELISLMSEHKNVCEQTESMESQITTLKQEKENLVDANSKLFQRVGFENNLNDHHDSQKVDSERKLSIGDIINDKGEFI